MRAGTYNCRIANRIWVVMPAQTFVIAQTPQQPIYAAVHRRKEIDISVN